MAAKVDQEALTAPGSKAPAHSPAEPQQDRPAPAPARRHHGLIAFAALAVASLEYGLLERGGFWLDDFVNLAEARRLGLSGALLVEPVYQHFAPGHRLLDWLVAVPFRESYRAAVLILVLCIVGTVVTFALLLDACFGRRDV